MDNATMCHNFFYSPRRDYNIQSCNMWYKDNRIYSYNTCIGELATSVSGEQILLVSDNNFSITTAKHIGILRYACPFRLVELPQRWNNHQFNCMDSIEAIAYNLSYSNKNLHKKNNREQFIHSYKMLRNTLDIDIFQSQKGTITTLLNEYITIYKQLNNSHKIKEISCLIWRCREHNFKTLAKILLIGYYTGLRINNILSLKKSNIDNNKLLIKDIKTKSYYTIPISNKIKFITDNFKPFDLKYQQVYYQFNLIKQELKLDKQITIHTLRHSFCSNLINKGVPITTIQKLANHKKLTTTVRYSHINEQELQKAISML